jgi:hypothetical protein
MIRSVYAWSHDDHLTQGVLDGNCTFYCAVFSRTDLDCITEDKFACLVIFLITKGFNRTITETGDHL